MTAKVPKGLAERLTAMGIEAGMWADLVWSWQKYFGKSSCVGWPESMKADAAAQGKPYHRGQGMAASCFA
jgi:hypothetical protein